jgi:hypothetical protein|tara:strand:- start:91 stop:510 length:420 start_codon:yes stop_codon:yes gene_type:complete
MKAKQFKIATWFINEDLLHKVDIHYENETKRAYTLLDILASKYFKIDKRKKFNQIEITEEEYKTWYVYFLEYYIDDGSIYVGSKEEKEAKRLLKSLIKFFGQSNFDESHRAGGKIKFAISLAKKGVVASQISESNETKH